MTNLAIKPLLDIDRSIRWIVVIDGITKEMSDHDLKNFLSDYKTKRRELVEEFELRVDD